jgi:RES domain-containing protein
LNGLDFRVLCVLCGTYCSATFATPLSDQAAVIVFRIGSSAHSLLDGAGAASTDGARWNSHGRYVIYAAEHYATALIEKAAQLNSIRIPRTLVFVQIDVPTDVSAEEVRPEGLPGWDDDDKAASQRFGDHWYDARRSLVLFVPALAAPGLERNVLINERHPQFGRITASAPEPVRCHPRLRA